MIEQLSKQLFTTKTALANLLAPWLIYLAGRIGLDLSPDAALELALVIMSAINIVLRLFTSTPAHVTNPVEGIPAIVTNQEKKP